ncbi:hypothetical protein Anapl_14100 [Anas platyrhynchos]|uniref:Uncharacterized protein n=1 Tax=Anas platyrhynchos TaxID=8839 RepID=R0L0B1_ANAPL|nr:hypothetical protein Anapl_14100 [Anas platyrhynchos]
MYEQECCHPIPGKHVEVRFVNKQVNMHVVSQYLKGTWECISSENMNTSEDACCHPIPEKHVEMHIVNKHMNTLEHACCLPVPEKHVEMHFCNKREYAWTRVLSPNS